ncbi:MAG TPA: DUF2269 family protein [Candidatus Limnocylindrales bacterium]|nr:DUF2269 family protein [Candidatus Limnocylindrales bacterium]
MPDLFPFLLFLHTMFSIVALGPAYAFPLIGMMGGREPRFANFATRLTHVISDRMVEPSIVVVGVTGVLLIWSRDLPVFEPAYRWLLLSIVLYVGATLFAWLVQRPTTIRIIELSGGPGGPIPALASPGPGAAGGPPPELAAAVRRSQRNGLILMTLSVVMILLMVMKPSLGS